MKRERTVGVPRRRAIEPVTKDRAADGGKMNAELVGAAREGLEVHEAYRVLDRAWRSEPSTTRQPQGRMLPRGDTPPRSHRRTPMTMVDFVPRWALVIACEWKGDRARDLGWLASNDSKIAFGHTSLLEGDAECHACFPAPREDEKPRRVAVKAMHRFQRAKGRCQP